MLRTTDNLPNLMLELQSLIAQIPPGRVATCGVLAEALGDRRAAKWVGHWLLHHEHLPGCNCHRVVRAGGALGGYGDGPVSIKQELLESEGVAIRASQLDLDGYRFDAFVASRPLDALRDEQDALAGKLKLVSWDKLPEQIGGLDVSYSRQGEAVAAYTVVDTESGELLWSATVAGPVSFPYIPTYLTYREFPALSAAVSLARDAGQLAELTLVDGTGILHPRRLGVATHFGIVAGIATVGIAKALLCGRVAGEPRIGMPARIFDNDDLLGIAICPGGNSKHPLYVSPGQGVDVATAERAVAQMLRGRRLPEPIYWADRLSRAAARVK